MPLFDKRLIPEDNFGEEAFVHGVVVVVGGGGDKGCWRPWWVDCSKSSCFK